MSNNETITPDSAAVDDLAALQLALFLIDRDEADTDDSDDEVLP